MEIAPDIYRALPVPLPAHPSPAPRPGCGHALFEESNQTCSAPTCSCTTGMWKRSRNPTSPAARGARTDQLPEQRPRGEQHAVHPATHLLHELAGLRPKTLAIMHGSSSVGNGEFAVQDVAQVMKKIYGGREWTIGPGTRMCLHGDIFFLINLFLIYSLWAISPGA